MSKTKTQSNKYRTIQFNRHWGSMAKGYLHLAEVGLRFYEKQHGLGKIRFGNKTTFSLEDGNTIVAAIWNIKHGIELLIKGLGVNLDKRYWNIHNLQDLLVDLDNRMSGLYIEQHFDRLRNLVDKYYRSQFWRNAPSVDGNNILFRYPDTGLDYSYVHTLTKKQIREFLKDIHNLNRLTDLLEGTSEQFESAQKLGLPKEEVEKQMLNVPTMKNPGFK